MAGFEQHTYAASSTISVCMRREGERRRSRVRCRILLLIRRDKAGSIDCNKNGLPTHFLGNIDRQSNPIPSELPMKKIISHHSCGVPNEDEDNNRPPTPWARSKSKQNIIDNLKDKNSDIHLLIGDYDDKTNQIKVVEITSNGNEWQGCNNQRGEENKGTKLCTTCGEGRG